MIDGHDVGALRERAARGASTPTARSSSTSTPSRARASRPPRRAASRGWRSGTPPSRSSIVDGSRPAPKPVAGQGVRLARRRSRPEKLEKPPAPAAPPQYTAVFADALVAEAKRDQRVIGITAAMAGGTGLDKLAEEVPEQYYDVGIAEQDAVLFASGLALQGAKPVCAIYSTFLQRAFDQIVHDVCLQKLERRLRDGPRRPGRRRRPDPPRRLRHLLLPRRSRTSS